MKQTVLICLSMLCTCLGWGQQLVPLHKPVCSLPIVWSHEEQIKVPPPRTVHHVHPRSANFVVNYLPSGTQNGPMPGDTCESWDANAMTAFSYAADIWGGHPQFTSRHCCRRVLARTARRYGWFRWTFAREYWSSGRHCTLPTCPPQRTGRL